MASTTAPGAAARAPVCAIGASAGGVQALKAFFRHVPADLGLAYVVIIHLAPDHPSALTEILKAVTPMDVREVADPADLEPDCVYVIPPDRELVITDNQIAARPFRDPRGHRAPIDTFFQSVAAGVGDGLAVILSGAGADGAVGVCAIKEGGGIILVQDPSEAEFPMMPRSALASGVADIVAPIPRLVECMVEIAQSKDAVRSLSEDAAHQQLQGIVAYLRTRTGHDFSSYKRAGVMRRVVRRMQVNRCASLPQYVDYMTSNPEEAQELFSDLLISVTSFFRDPAAYDALAAEGIPALFDAADEAGIRAWVVGCATGEEAYSLAILMLEEADRRQVRLPIQIFASDLSEGALATAREARYPAGIEADVSPERLERHFVKEGLHYRVASHVRDMVLFASHSVIKDPPFMRMDLISCRNMLIYMERQLQREVCALFAYGLRPQGLLFLGSAETVDAAPELFTPVRRDARLYRVRNLGPRALPALSLMPAEHRPPGLDPPRPVREPTRDRPSGSMHLTALERTAPPSILVDRGYHALHLSQNAGRFLLPSAGPVSTDLVDMIRPELRLDLRTALRRALDLGQPTLTAPLPVAFEDGRHEVILHVAPVHASGTDAGKDTGTGSGEDGAPQALVVLLDGGPAPEPPRKASSPGSRTELHRLRESLDAAEARLVATRAEHEATIQDLRVANEELQSLNEEYRSASEELETSKEELQSMNEELRTVNAELKSKLESIGSAHSDLKNIIAATDIGTLFLDRHLRIRMFTPRIADLFNVTDADVGRVITDFTHQLDSDGLEEDVARVLRDLVPAEREIRTRDGRWLVMRLRPYRTIDEHIEGAVVTFVDITAQRETSERLRESEEQKDSLLRLSDVLRPLTGTTAIRGDACRLLAGWLHADRAFHAEVDDTEGVARIAGAHARDGMAPLDGTHDLGGSGWLRRIVRRRDGVAIADARVSPLVPEDDRAVLAELGIVSLLACPIIRDDRLVGALAVACRTPRGWTGAESELVWTVADRLSAMVERATAEAALRDSEARFSALTRATSDVLYRMTPDWSAMLELRSDGFLEETTAADSGWADHYILAEDQPRVRAQIATAIRDKAPFELEHRVLRADGTIGWTMSRAIPILDADGEISEWFGAAADVTDRRRSEGRLREARDALLLATRASQLGWGAWDFSTGLSDWDARAREIIGLGPDENSIDDWMQRVLPADRARILAEVETCVQQQRPFDLEYGVVQDDGSERRVHATGHFQKREDTGAVSGTGLVRDVTEARRWAQSQRLLIGELNHRVKNMLAVIQSVARQTQRTTTDVETFIEAFGNRVQTLAAAHDILTRRQWSGAELEEIARVALETFTAGDGRAVVGGPRVRLGPDATISLAMALHELATNALKHGALSSPSGRVAVTWSLSDAGKVVLEWRESDGPEVTPPTRQGFGTRLLERGIARELDGEVELDYRRDGLYWRMEFTADDPNRKPRPQDPGGRG